MLKPNIIMFSKLFIFLIFIKFLLSLTLINDFNTLQTTTELEIQNNKKQLKDLQLEIDKLKDTKLNDLSIELNEYDTALNMFLIEFNNLVTENF